MDGVREAIQAAGADLLYLPPYSPDFNPIEQVFAKLKALLRKYEERAIATLWARLGKLVDCFSKNNARTTSGTADICPHYCEKRLKYSQLKF